MPVSQFIKERTEQSIHNKQDIALYLDVYRHTLYNWSIGKSTPSLSQLVRLLYICGAKNGHIIRFYDIRKTHYCRHEDHLLHLDNYDP